MSKSRLPYYKAYPRDFIEGTIGMEFEIKCAYRVVLDLIYMQSGKLPDDARYISGLLGCSIRKWKSIRSALIEAGKLQVSGEFLSNYRAVSELESLSKLQEKKAENRRHPNKNKDLQERSSHQPEPEPKKEKELSKDSSKKDSRLPDDWLAPKSYVEWPIQNLGWTLSRTQGQLAQFKDHWIGKSGAQATKLDWLATWRNWCRNDERRNPTKPQGRSMAQIAAERWSQPERNNDEGQSAITSDPVLLVSGSAQ